MDLSLSWSVYSWTAETRRCTCPQGFLLSLTETIVSVVVSFNTSACYFGHSRPASCACKFFFSMRPPLSLPQPEKSLKPFLKDIHFVWRDWEFNLLVTNSSIQIFFFFLLQAEAIIPSSVLGGHGVLLWTILVCLCWCPQSHLIQNCFPCKIFCFL